MLNRSTILGRFGKGEIFPEKYHPGAMWTDLKHMHNIRKTLFNQLIAFSILFDEI